MRIQDYNKAMEDQNKQPQAPSASLTSELLEMGFGEQLVKQAMGLYQNKEQAINYLLSKQAVQQPIKAEQGEFEDDQEQDYKMIFVVRSDLKLALHKIAELVATGALRAYRQIEALVEVDEMKELAFYEWTEGGQKKIVVKAPAEKDLLELAEKAKNANINFVLVKELPGNLKFQKPQVSAPKKKAKGEAKQQQQGKQQGKLKPEANSSTKNEGKPQEKIENNPSQKSVEKLSEKLQGTLNASLQQKSQAKPEQKSKDEQQTRPEIRQKNLVQQPPLKPQQPHPQQKMQQQLPILVLGAFGPASQSQLDPLTKHFKLL